MIHNKEKATIKLLHKMNKKRRPQESIEKVTIFGKIKKIMAGKN